VCHLAARWTRRYSGNGGQAAAALMNGPRGLLFDRAGNLLFAGYYNNRLRQVSPSGVITTVGGRNIISPGRWPDPPFR